jgi:hypothetical protein
VCLLEYHELQNAKQVPDQEQPGKALLGKLLFTE